MDASYEAWTTYPIALEEAFKNHNPKAVIGVNLHSVSVQIKKIKDICKKYNTSFIEDSSESLGTIANGQ